MSRKNDAPSRPNVSNTRLSRNWRWHSKPSQKLQMSRMCPSRHSLNVPWGVSLLHVSTNSPSESFWIISGLSQAGSLPLSSLEELSVRAALGGVSK
jgi:hypothetical protein